MKYRIIAVGRMRAGPEKEIMESYFSRISPRPLLVEVEEKRALGGEKLKQAEGRLLSAQVTTGARVIALDENGKNISSRELAGVLQGWRDEGVGETDFIIGGADGLDRELAASADMMLSLGRLTWPHMLVRAMLGEQIYRAGAIMAGHPYHRD